MNDDEILPFQSAHQEVDVVGPAPDNCRLEWATVGWTDKDDWFDTNEDPNDGITLVRVTTFAGRTMGTPIEAGVAAGTQYLAQIMGPFWRIPKKGERCIIGIPSGMEQSPGSVVILGFPGAAPGNQYAKNRAKMDLGEDVDLIIKARSITLSDYDNRFIYVGPDLGICIQEKDGTGIIVKDGAVLVVSSDGTTIKSMLQLKNGGVDLCVMGGGLLQLDANKAHLFGQDCYVQGGGVYLGSAPLAVNKVEFTADIPGGPIPNQKSASVFISP